MELIDQTGIAPAAVAPRPAPSPGDAVTSDGGTSDAGTSGGPPPGAVLWLRGLHHELLGQGGQVSAGAGPGKAPAAGARESRPPAAGAGSSNKYTVVIDELVIPDGSFLAIRGPSGCGKTTLLTILGLARRPAREDGRLPAVDRFQLFRRPRPGDRGPAGVTRFDLVELWGRTGSGREIEALRRSFLGFALQSGELLPNLSVYENVELPLRLNGASPAAARQRVRHVLELFGTAQADGTPSDKLWLRRRHLPGGLSGGEYQRVALARALAHRPHILFLDEPTNNLDPRTAGLAISSLVRLQRDEGLTVVMITHDKKLAEEFATHIVEMDSPGPGLGHISGRHVRDPAGAWRPADARWRPAGWESIRAAADDAARRRTPAAPGRNGRAAGRGAGTVGSAVSLLAAAGLAAAGAAALKWGAKRLRDGSAG